MIQGSIKSTINLECELLFPEINVTSLFVRCRLRPNGELRFGVSGAEIALLNTRKPPFFSYSVNWSNVLELR